VGDRKRVILFQDGSKGIGQSKLEEGTIHSSISWDCRTPGQAAPSFKHSTSPNSLGTTPWALYNGQSTTWLDSTDYLLLHTQGAYVQKMQANVVSEDLIGGFSFTGSAMHDDGSGAAYWYLCAGTSEHIRRRTSAGVWTQDDDVHADLMRSINGDLYRTLGANIYKCPAGSDPFTVANWSAAIQVGTPQWNITGLASAGNAPIVGKPDGLYRYNAADSKYEDVLLGSLKSCAHPDNGKGMSTWREFALYPLHDGGLLAFDGFRVYDWSPTKDATPDRDTPYGFRLTAFASAGPQGFYAAQDIGNVRTQQGISKVYWFDATGAGTYNDITTNVTDSKPSTTGTVGPGGAGDYLYVGADIKFRGVFFKQSGLSNTLLASGSYYNGAWTSVSQLGISYMIEDGCIYSALSLSDWVPTTVNGVAGKYWWRFSMDSGFTGAGTLKELYIIPYRPAVGIVAGNDYTGLDRVNLLTHILYCRPRGDNADWSDLAALLLELPANRLEVTDAAITADNTGSKLAVLSSLSYRYVLLGNRETPQLTPFPQCQKSATQVGVPYLELGGTDFDWPEKSKALRKLFLHFDNLDDGDRVEVFCRWDQNTAWWKAVQSNTAPFTVEFPAYDAQQGVVCHVGISLNDAAVESACPVLRLVEAEVEDMGDFGAVAQPVVTTLEVM
jgi:hypothetical protein